jgi:glutamate-1-semialdehyde 2,1-aminomutase
LVINLFGIPALIGFNINSVNTLIYKTFITQEMLKKGYLAANSIYVSTAHTKEILDGYFTELEELFLVIQKCETQDLDVNGLLDGPVCHAGFKRLN